MDGLDPAAWAPFTSRLEFAFADFHFSIAQSSAANISTALDLWAAAAIESGGTMPWNSPAEMYETIDAINDGNAPWRTYAVRYSGPLPAGQPPRWMTQDYHFCTQDLREVLHNQLSTTSLKDHVDYVPYRQFNHAGKRVWSNFMSGDWAWRQAVGFSLDCFVSSC